jgi:hypothetical protein
MGSISRNTQRKQSDEGGQGVKTFRKLSEATANKWLSLLQGNGPLFEQFPALFK